MYNRNIQGEKGIVSTAPNIPSCTRHFTEKKLSVITQQCHPITDRRYIDITYLTQRPHLSIVQRDFQINYAGKGKSHLHDIRYNISTLPQQKQQKLKMVTKINNSAKTFPTAEEAGLLSQITLAASTQWYVFPKKSDWLVREGFALEYTPDPDNLNHLSKHLAPYLAGGTRIRHHGYFPGYEIGDKRPGRAEQAMQLHFQALEAMKGHGEQNITVHVGLTADVELDHDRVVRNLARLVEYGRFHGITVSLENLRFGPTSNPEIVLDWTQKSGAKITMDIGHAVSCERVANNELSVPQIIDMFSHNMIEVHFYESETDRHHAPQDMTILGPVVDKLLTTNCPWWTIELDTYEDILRTRKLISDHIFLTKKQPTILSP
jgi:hypothetical protein